MYPSVDAGGHSGPGEFVVIPSFEGCGCEYNCVLLDDYEMHSGCVCPENGLLREDGTSCVGEYRYRYKIIKPFLPFLLLYSLNRNIKQQIVINNVFNKIACYMSSQLSSKKHSW